MRVIVSVCILFFYSTNLISQKDTAIAYFIGIYDKNENGKTGLCSDRGLEMEEVSNYNEYAHKAKLFNEKYKGRWPSTQFLDKNSAAIVYESEKAVSGWNCKTRYISVLKDMSVMLAKENLANKVKTEPKAFLTEPKILFTWYGAPTSNVVESDYDGVIAKYTLTRSGDLFVQMKNRKVNEIAYVAFISGDSSVINRKKFDSKDIQVYKIAPKGSLTTTIKNPKNFAVEIKYLPYEGKEESLGLFDWVKEQIRDYVSTKDKKIKKQYSVTCMCIRG